MGRPPKRPEHRQRRNIRNDYGLVERDPTRPVPPGDRAWLKATARAWVDYWQSDVSGLVQRDSDTVALKRLFDYRDEHARALSAFRKERTLADARGLTKVSPMAALMIKLERLIVPLEDRYGLSSMARLRLGAELGGMRKTLADLNALDESPGGHDGGEDDDENTIDADVYQLPGLPAAE